MRTICICHSETSLQLLILRNLSSLQPDSTRIYSRQVLSFDNYSLSLSLQRYSFYHQYLLMARYRYTINHPSFNGPARVSDAPAKHVIKQLSSETPSSDHNPLPVQECLTSNEPESLLISPSSCSQAERTSSTQPEPIPTTTPLPTTVDHHEILVLPPKSTKLPAATALRKQENAPGKVISVKPEEATLFATGNRAMKPSQVEKESSPPTCYLLKLPVDVRTQIYGYLFWKSQRAVLGSGEAGKLKVRFTKTSGIALCFTCRHIEDESRPSLYKHLQWVLEKDTPYVSLLSTPFHHTN